MELSSAINIFYFLFVYFSDRILLAWNWQQSSCLCLSSVRQHFYLFIYLFLQKPNSQHTDFSAKHNVGYFKAKDQENIPKYPNRKFSLTPRLAHQNRVKNLDSNSRSWRKLGRLLQDSKKTNCNENSVPGQTPRTTKWVEDWKVNTVNDCLHGHYNKNIEPKSDICVQGEYGILIGWMWLKGESLRKLNSEFEASLIYRASSRQPWLHK